MQRCMNIQMKIEDCAVLTGKDSVCVQVNNSHYSFSMTKLDSRFPTLFVGTPIPCCIHNNLHASITDTSNTCDIIREESFQMTRQAHMETGIVSPRNGVLYYCRLV
jgi:hypothetical protein